MADAGQDRLTAPAELLEALRASGAAGQEPVRFRFLEALARRAEGHSGEARRLIEAKLAHAAAALGARCRQARLRARIPAANDAHASPNPLADLLATLGDQATPTAARHTLETPAGAAPLAELKSVTQYRKTWSRLSADQQITEALAQVPENAGPFNPHLLAMRALQRLHEISPEALAHWLGYLDALMWLEQAQGTGRPVTAKREKKPVVRRAPPA